MGFFTIRCSKLEQRALCAGSEEAERGLPDIPNKWAAPGVRIHNYITNTLATDGMSEDEIQTGKDCRKLTLGVLEKLGARDWEYFHEVEMSFQWKEFELKGHGDLLYINKERTTGIFFDFKTGRGETTPAEENIQLRGYAVLAAIKFQLKEVYVVIIQPWVTWDSVIAHYGYATLLQAQNDIDSIFEAASKKEATRTPGLKQCKHCLARTTCPEAVNTSLAQVGVKNELMTPQERGQFLHKLIFAQKIIKDSIDEAKTMLKCNPESIEGWTLSEGNGTRQIKDPSKAFECISHLVTGDEFEKICKPTIGGLEDLVKSKLNLKGKEFDETFEEIMKPAITIKKNEPSLKEKK